MAKKNNTELPGYQEGGSTPSGNDRNTNTVPVNSERKAPESSYQPKRLDYFGLKFTGNKDMNINRMEYQDPNLKVNLMPREQAFEHYKPFAEQAGIEWTEEGFNKMYDAAEDQYANYRQRRWDEGINEVNYRRRHGGFYAQALSPLALDTTPSHFNFFQEGDTRWALQNGRIKRTKTDQEFMDERGFYKPYLPDFGQNEEGGSVLNRYMGDWAKEQEEGFGKRKYIDVNIGGSTQRMGELDDFLESYGGFDVRPGPGGQTILKQSYDDNGLPMWEEVSMFDEVHGSESVRSAWGPRKMYSNWAENLWDSAVINTIAGLPSNSMSFIDWVVDGWEMANPMLPYSQVDSSVDKADRYAMNHTAWKEVRTPEDIRYQAWDESAESFWWHGGGALGSIAEMILTRKASTKTLKLFGLADDVAMKTGAFLGSGVMALDAAGGFKRAMVEAGVPERHQFALYLPALIGSYAVERMGGNILDDGLKAFYGKQNVKKYVQEGIGESMKEFGVGSMEEMTKQQVKSTGKRIWNNMLGASRTGFTKATNIGKKGLELGSRYAPTPLKAALEEGFEEVVEGRLYESMNIINDWYTNTFEQNGEDYDKYGFVAEEDANGNPVYYRYDKFTKERRPVTEETYLKGVEGSKIKPGDGMMGEYNPNLGFFGNWNKRVWDGMDADFVMGAFAGGLMGTFQSVKGGQKQLQGKIIQDYAVRGETDFLRTEFKKMWENGDFGPKDITPDKKVLDPKNPEMKSMNDVGYAMALQELEEAETYVKKMGVTDPMLLREMMQSDQGMNLLREGYANVVQQSQVQREIDDLTTQMGETTDKELISNLQKQIEEKETLKKDLNLQLQEIQDGTRFKERITSKMIEKWSLDNNVAMVHPDGGKYIPGIHELNNFNKRFDKQRKEKIDQISEAKSTRGKLENQVSSMIDSMFSSPEANVKTTEGMSDFFEKLMDVQTQAADVGLSEKGAQKLIEKLEGYRQAIIDNIDNYFTEEQIAEAKATAEITESDYKEALQAELPGAKKGTPAGSAYEWSQNLDSAIKSFGDQLEKSDVQAGDLVQWTSQGKNQFPKPRKLESISEDGKFGKVEGSDTPIPLQELHKPDFQGGKIKGKIPAKFSEDEFKNSFYDSYVDTQGNEISITNTLADLASRKMNDEDYKTLMMLEEAIKNNKYLADVNNKALGPLMDDKTFDFGKYRPSNESRLTDDQYNQITDSLEQKLYLLQAIKIKQEQDVNDKINREGRIRYNDYLIRNDIVQMMSKNREFDLDVRNKLVSIYADVVDKTNAIGDKYLTEKKYERMDLDEVDPLLVEAESLIHKELNGPNSKKIYESLGFLFRNYKGLQPEARLDTYHDASEFVMHDFDSAFNHEAFFEKIDNLKNAPQAVLAKTQFARLYFQNHMQTLQRMDPKQFYSQYSAILSEIEVDEGIVPSYEQMKVINHSVAFMLKPNNDVLMAIEDTLLKSSKGKSKTKDFNFNRSLFIRGFAGTGKTSLVIKSAASMYSNIIGRKLNIDTSAPSRDLQKSLNSNLTSIRENANQPGMTFNELITHIDNKDGSFKNTDLLIIDEASNLNKTQVDTLKESLNKSGAKGNMTIMFLGDQSQMTSVNQKQSEHLAVERIMERTMPTTEVFRSGAADISNLQSAYRNAIYKNKDAILPKGTFDNAKNNGLEYFNGTKKDMYDKFADDLNGSDTFKNNNTALIVYTKSDREAAINYVRKKVNDPNMDLDSVIKTIEEGEFSAQGLEYGRVLVAIDETDAKHLYNRAMLTAATRAKKIDDDHNGYAMVLSKAGYSEEGDPIIVETKTSSDEDLARANNWIQSILGDSFNPETNVKQSVSQSSSDVTPEGFAGFQNNLKSILGRGKIEFSNAKFNINDIMYRYKIKDKGVQSVTEKLSDNIKKSSQEGEPLVNTAHADRGSAIHKIVESYLNKQKKKGGKLFTKKDIEEIRGYIQSYNSEIEAWNKNAKNESAKLSTINLDADELIFEKNAFVEDVLKNVAEPIANKLNQNGIYSLPESIIGIYYNDIAGTIDIVDMVGMEGSMPVVDIYDIKTLTPGSHRYFGDSNEESKLDLGVIKTFRDEVMPANKLNQALSQLATYKAILEKGDSEIGLAPVKVRNVNIIKAMVDGDNNIPALTDGDFVQYDSEGQPFEKFKNFGSDIVNNGEIRAEKGRKEYDLESPMLGQLYIDLPGSYASGTNEIQEITGVYKTKDGNFVEINHDKAHPMTLSDFNSQFSPYTSEPTPDPKTQTEEAAYNSSALQFEQGNSYAFGTASTYLQEGYTNLDNEHAQFKSEYLRSIAKNLRPGSPSAPKMDLVFHPEIQLLSDDGKLKTFKNVMLAKVSDKSMMDLVKIAKTKPWGKGSNEQVIKAIKDRGFDIMATLPNPESNFGKKENNINYANEAEVAKLMKRIKSGFKKNGANDKYHTELVNWHTHLAALRAMGAKNPGEVMATVSVRSVSPGAVIYDGTERSYKDLLSNLANKGFKIGRPYFNNRAAQTTDETGSVTNVASWMVDVWKIDPKIDGSKIFLRTGAFDDAHYQQLKKSIEDLKKDKAAVFSQINNTDAFRFLQENRSFLIDPKTGNISSQLPDLSNYIQVKGPELQLIVPGPKTMPKLLESLSRAIDAINTARQSGNKIAQSLRKHSGITTGDNGKLVLPRGAEGNLFTSAKNVNHFGFQLNTKAIDTSEITNVKNGVTQNSDGIDPDIARMGIIDPNPNSAKDYMEELDENTFAHDAEPETETDQNSRSDNNNTYYAYAVKYFGDIKLMNQVKKDVARNVIYESNWNRRLDTPVVSVGEMMANTMEYYKRVASKIPTQIDVQSDNFHFTDLSQISGESVHLLNKDQFGRYFHYTLGTDQDLLMSVMQKLFPSLDLKSMSVKDLGADLHKKIEGDEEIKVLNEESQGNVMDNLEERALTDTLSAFVHLHVNHIPLRTFTYTEDDNITFEESLTAKVDPKTIHKALIDAAQMSHWPDPENPLWEEDKIDRWHRNLENIALEAGVGTKTYDNIMSFIHTFFSEDPQMMSHKYIRDNSIARPGQQLSNLDIETTYDSEVISVKGTASDNLLSALYSHFLSASSKKSVANHTKGRGDKKTYKQKTQSLAIGAHIAQNIQNRLNNTIFALNDGGLEVSEDIAKQISGKDASYKIQQNGILDARFDKPKMIVQFNLNKGRITEFSIPEGVEPSDIKDALNVFGMKELVYAKTIQNYLNTAEDKINEGENKKDRAKLAEIVGMMMLSARSAVEPGWSGESLVESYYNENGYSRDSLENLNDDATLDASSVGEDLYKPTDLYRLYENLGKAQSDVQLQNHSRHYYNVQNKKVFRDTNGSTLHQTFPAGDISGVKPSSGIKSFFKTLVETNSDEDLQFNPLVNDDGKVLNAIADPESGWDIDDVYITDGTKTEYKSVRQGKNMSDLDFADMNINGMFIEDVLKGRRIEKVKIPYHNTANKSALPVFVHKFSDKPVFKKTEGGIEIDKAWRDQQVINQFEYHNNARLTSYRKWADLINQIGGEVDGNLIQAWMEDPDSFQAAIMDVQNSIPNFKDIVMRSHLTVRKDYAINKDGYIIAGNAPLMNVDNVYNFRNMQNLKKAEDRSAFIDKLFFQRNMNAAVQLRDIGFKLHPKLKNRRLFYTVGKTEQGGNIWKVNPTLEAFFYAYHFADHNTSQLLQGDVTQYKDIADLFKRSTGPVAPRWVPDTASPRGIGKVSNAIIVEDIQGTPYEQLQTLFGKDGTYEETDGLGLINPISYILLRNSYGGKDLGVIGDGMIKPVYYKNDLHTNEAVYFKYALLPITQQTLENSTIAQEAFRKMVGNDLFNMWQQGSSFEELADYVLKNDLRDKIAMQVVFGSGVKTGASKINRWDDPEWGNSVTVDNDYFGIQLNASQDVTNTELSIPTQLLGQVGIGAQNKARVQRINQIKAELAMDGLSELASQFEVEPGVIDKGKFFEFLREMGIQASSEQGDIGKYAEMLHDKQVDLNVPTIRSKTIQQLLNRITSKSIKPKWNGVRMSQAPGVFFRLYEDEAGNTFMLNEVNKYGVQPKAERELQPMKFYTDPDFKNEIKTREEFEAKKAAGEVFVKPGDVIMPFSYFEQFGIKEYVDADPSFSLNDVFMFQFSDGKMRNLKNVPSEELADLLNAEYTANRAAVEAGTAMEATTFLQTKFNSPEKAFKFLENFKESLKLIDNRIPSSSTSSAFIGEIVGWINDNGNTVYTSAAKNILDGGDYDIDQLNVYFKAVNKSGNIMAVDQEGKGSRKAKMNEMFDLLQEYYQDPENADLYMSPISLANLRGEVESIKSKMQKFVNDHNDFGSNLYYNDKISQGDNLIGVFANVIKNYSYLAHAVTINPNVVKKVNIRPDGANEIGQYVINVLESFMNAATDNAKELILGVVGATEDAGNIIGAAGIKGKTENEIVSLLLSEAVQDVFKKVKYSKRSDNAKHLKVLEAIDNKIQDLEENQTQVRQDLEDKIKELDAKLSQGPDAIQIDDVVEDENGFPHILSPADIRSAQNAVMNEWLGQRDAYQATLNNLGPFINNELDRLYELKDLAYLGEAITRLNTITKIDSNGLPVFDYQLDKQIRDIEFNMGMTMSDFLNGKQANKDWFKSRKAYIHPDKIQEFMMDERAIRSYIDIPGVIRTLPHIESYVQVMDRSKNWIKQSFVRNSEVVQDAVDQFLLEKRLDWFTSEQAYYSFYKELDNFMISMYFGTEFKSRRFQSITGITKDIDIDISTPEGRYQFGMEFPRSIMDKMEKLNAAGADLNNSDRAIRDNHFMRSLVTASTSTGEFLEFRDSYKLGDEDYADLRASFKTLPEGLKEQFYIYQLAKDGFSFTKGGLYEAMDNELFRRYSEFIEQVDKAATEYTLGNEYNFHLNDSTGRQVTMSFENMLNDVFLKDVGFYSDDMVLLQRYNKNWTQDSVPNQYKIKEKKGAFLVEMVKDHATDEVMQGATKKTFNPYNPTRSNMTTGQVLRKLSYENYSKIKQKQNVTVKFNDAPSFNAGNQLHLPDGSLAEIKQKGKNSIVIGPSLKTDPMHTYKSEGRKKELLNMISQNSKNEMHQAISTFLLENTDGSYLSNGMITYTNESLDEDFKKAAEQDKKVTGWFDSKTRNIAVNMSQVKTQDKFERTVLHEMLHDYTIGALEATSQDLAKLGESARPALRFKSDIKKIYNAAKAQAGAEGKKLYGMKNEKEFVSEAFTNPKFQAFLGKVEAVGDLKTKAWYESLWDSFKTAIQNLLGMSTPNTPTALDQVIGVTNRFIQDKGYEFSAINVGKSTKYFMQEDTTPQKEIIGTIDILDALQPDGVMKNFSQFKEEEMINNIYNNINVKSNSYYYNGEKFYFKKKNGEPMDELESKAKIKKEILPKFTEFETQYKNTVIDWLNEGANIEGSSPANRFPKKGGGSRYNPKVLAELKRYLDHDVNDVYMRYSDLKDNPDYKGLKYIEEFKGHDPIVIVHKSIDGKDESISIFDATSLNLGKKGIEQGNILKKYIDNDKKAFNEGVTLGNNEGDLRRLLVGLQAMAMKQANPNLKVKHIGVLGVNNSGVDSVWVYMEDFLDNVNAIKSVEELYSIFPESITNVLNDESLFEDNYEQPWIFMLKRKLEEKANELADIDGQEFNYKKTHDAIDQLEAYLNGEGSKAHTLEMMINRQHELEGKYSENQLLEDREYQYLSNTIKELSTIPSFEKNSTKDLDKVKASWSPSHNIDHEIVTWAQRNIMDGMNYVEDVVAKFQKDEFYPLLEEFNKRYFIKHPEQRAMDYLQDLSGKKFKPLFKTRKVKDRQGNEVEINSSEIHFDMNDPETKAAISRAEITPKDVEFGKFVVDKIESEMIANLMHINRYNKKYKKEDAEKELSEKWRRGMIPVMSSSVNEMLMKKDPKSVKAAYKKFMNKLGNVDDIYDELGKKKQKDTKRQRILKEMSDYFMHQIGKDSEEFGSDSRMRLMGLSNELTGPVLTDPELNKNLSTNLELTLLYMVSSSTRKRHFETKVLPYVNSAQSMLHAADLSRLEGDQTNAISYLTNYVNSTIKGMSETLDSKVGGVHVDPAINQVIAVASFNGLAWNLPVGLTSGMMNITQFMSNAVANDMAQDGMYGRKDMQKALELWGTKKGRQKIEGIMEMYKIADRSERDIVHNPRRKVTNKNIFTSHSAHWFNWVTDYNVRGLVAAAQMYHDGSINAYEMKGGKLVYDESKDPTWNGEDGKVLKQNMKERLVEDGYMESIDDKMPRGYDNRMARNLKWLSDKYIIGGMDDTTKTRMARMTLGKPFMQFASYLPDKLGNYFGSQKASPVAGRYKVVRNEDNKPETVWEKNITEGMFQTFKSLYTDLRKNNYKSMKKWSEMKPYERRNVSKFAMDMMQFTILYTLYAGLTQVDWDDDEKGKQTVVKDSRFMRVFKYAALDFLVWNPITLSETMSAIPSLEQAQRLGGIFVGDFSQVERTLPLSTTVRSIGEVLPEGEE